MKRLVALAAVISFAVAGCSTSSVGSPSDSPTSASAASGAGLVNVVASTNVYGDIVKTIGGPAVAVTSIIDNPEKDPHEYEADARTQLALSKAQLVIENGGGYDDFMDTLLSATDATPTLLTAVEVAGLDTGAEGFNEHVWYDLPAMSQLTGRIADALAEIDPDGADAYAANAAELQHGIAVLVAREEQGRAAIDGAGVAVTEPVPGYLLDALGAQDRTPADFSEAIEEGRDVAPAVLRHTLGLFSTGQVRALVYNEQTSGPETEQVLHAARSAGIAVVPVTETLPDGEHYLSWMGGNLDAVVAALTA